MIYIRWYLVNPDVQRVHFFAKFRVPTGKKMLGARVCSILITLWFPTGSISWYLVLCNPGSLVNPHVQRVQNMTSHDAKYFAPTFVDPVNHDTTLEPAPTLHHLVSAATPVGRVPAPRWRPRHIFEPLFRLQSQVSCGSRGLIGKLWKGEDKGTARSNVPWGDGETVVVADFAHNVAICGSRLGYWDIRARLACGGRGEPGDQLNAKWLPFRSPQSLPDLFPSDRVRARWSRSAILASPPHLFSFVSVPDSQASNSWRRWFVQYGQLCTSCFYRGPFIKLPRIALISYFGLNSSIVEVMEPPNNFEIWGGLDWIIFLKCKDSLT